MLIALQTQGPGLEHGDEIMGTRWRNGDPEGFPSRRRSAQREGPAGLDMRSLFDCLNTTAVDPNTNSPSLLASSGSLRSI